jgi:hypothetical protein
MVVDDDDLFGFKKKKKSWIGLMTNDHKSFFTNFLLDKIVKKDVPKNFIPIQKSSPLGWVFQKKYLNYKISGTYLNTQRGKNWSCEI